MSICSGVDGGNLDKQARAKVTHIVEGVISGDSGVQK